MNDYSPNIYTYKYIYKSLPIATDLLVGTENKLRLSMTNGHKKRFSGFHSAIYVRYIRYIYYYIIYIIYLYI